MANTHDTGYKLLFSTPELVRDLILGFVPDAESDKTLILHSIEEKGKAMSDSEIEKAYNLLFGDCSNG